MKGYWIQLVALIEIVFMVIPAPVFAGSYSGNWSSDKHLVLAGDNDGTNRAKCDTACSDYRTTVTTSAAFPPSGCAGISNSNPQTVIIGFEGKSFSSQTECTSAMLASFNQVGPACDARQLYGLAQDDAFALTITYAGVIVICTAAVAADLLKWTVVGYPAAAALDTGCGFADLGAMGAEIGLTVTLSNNGASIINQDATNGQSTDADKTLGSTSISNNPEIKAMARSGLSGATGLALIAGNIARAIAPKKAAEVTAEGIADGMSFSTLGAFLSLAFATAAALSYGLSMKSNFDSANQVCRDNIIPNYHPKTKPSATPPPDTAPSEVLINPKKPGGQDPGGNPIVYDPIKKAVSKASLILAGNPVPPGAAGAAMASNPGKSNIPDLLGSMGTSLDKLAAQIANGGGPSDFISGLDSLPADLTKAVGDISAAVQQGYAEDPSLVGRMIGSGGSSAAKSSGDDSGGFNPMAMFAGMGKEKQSAATDGALNFGAAGKPGDLGSDIFHKGSKATIFQIVSTKIDQVNYRVEKLAWASPLNRALQAAPASASAALALPKVPGATVSHAASQTVKK
jgi:hypothetical protein